MLIICAVGNFIIRHPGDGCQRCYQKQKSILSLNRITSGRDKKPNIQLLIVLTKQHYSVQLVISVIIFFYNGFIAGIIFGRNLCYLGLHAFPLAVFFYINIRVH